MSKKLKHYIFETSNLINIIVKIFINLLNLICTYQESKNILIKLNKKSKTTKKEYQKISRLYRLLMNTILYQPLISKLFNQPELLKLQTEQSTLFNKNLSGKIRTLNLSRYFGNTGLYYLNHQTYSLRNQKLCFPHKSILAFFPHNFAAYGYIFNGILSPYLDEDIYWTTSKFLSNPKHNPWTQNINQGLHIINVNDMKKYLYLNKKIGIVPGGFYDATLTQHQEINCYISIGSIKYSIDYEYNYIPVFTFGEENFYHQYYKTKHFLNTIEEQILHKFNIPTIFPKDNLLISGQNNTLITLIGKPINCNNNSITIVQNEIKKQITYLYNLSCKYFNNESKLKIHFQKIDSNREQKNEQI